MITINTVRTIAADLIAPVVYRDMCAAYRKALGINWDDIEQDEPGTAIALFMDLIRERAPEVFHAIDDRLTERNRRDMVNDMLQEDVEPLEMEQNFESEYYACSEDDMYNLWYSEI